MKLKSLSLKNKNMDKSSVAKRIASKIKSRNEDPMKGAVLKEMGKRLEANPISNRVMSDLSEKSKSLQKKIEGMDTSVKGEGSASEIEAGKKKREAERKSAVPISVFKAKKKPGEDVEEFLRNKGKLGSGPSRY